jgi:hypothetical protein
MGRPKWAARPTASFQPKTKTGEEMERWQGLTTGESAGGTEVTLVLSKWFRIEDSALVTLGMAEETHRRQWRAVVVRGIMLVCFDW